MLMKQLNYFALLLVVLMAMPVSSLQAKNKKDKTKKPNGSFLPIPATIPRDKIPIAIMEIMKINHK